MEQIFTESAAPRVEAMAVHDFMTIEEVAWYLGERNPQSIRQALRTAGIEPDSTAHREDIPYSERGPRKKLFSRAEINRTMLNGYDGEGRPKIVALKVYAEMLGVNYVTAYFSLIQRNPDALLGLVKIGGHYGVIIDQVRMTTEDMAQRFGFAADTIAEKARAGKIPKAEKRGGVWEFPPNTAIIYDVHPLEGLLTKELAQLGIGAMRPEENGVENIMGLSRAQGIGKVAQGTHMVSKDEETLRYMHQRHGIVPILIQVPDSTRKQKQYDTPFPGMIANWEDICTGGQELALRTHYTYPGVKQAVA